jgi:hypothetical protein
MLTFLIRLIPLLMQIFGIAGFIYGFLCSGSMLLGSGIGSPTGKPSEDLYVTATWMISLPALIFVIGWLWMVIGFLTAPKRRVNG